MAKNSSIREQKKLMVEMMVGIFADLYKQVDNFDIADNLYLIMYFQINLFGLHIVAVEHLKIHSLGLLEHLNLLGWIIMIVVDMTTNFEDLIVVALGH